MLYGHADQNLFPGDKKELIFSVFHEISDPSKAIMNIIKSEDKKIAITARQKKSFLYEYVKNLNMTINNHEQVFENGEYFYEMAPGYIFFENFVSKNLLSAIAYARKGISECDFLSSVRSVIKRAYSSHKEESELNAVLLKFIEKGIGKNNNPVLQFVNKYLQIFEIG